jgi:tol-pal system protein YbgF
MASTQQRDPTMNIRFLAICAATLVAFAPAAHAQRASLAERVAVLEQRAAADQGNVDLLRQVTALTSEVQALRGQLEETQHELQVWRESSRSQYMDVDSRLNRLEGGTTLPPTAALPPEGEADADSGPVVNAGAPLDVPVPTAPAAPVPAGEAERAAYGAAFEVLKAGRYDESARLFQDFTRQFPDGALVPNALYWLGESYYATQNYALALQQFRGLLERFPANDKAPGALLKLGLSQYGLGREADAESTLAEVGRRYPGSEAARTAADRLRAMQLSTLH